VASVRRSALALAADGVALALVARDADKLAETAAEARALGVRVETFVTDVTAEEQVNALQVHVAAKLGRVHILINKRRHQYSQAHPRIHARGVESRGEHQPYQRVPAVPRVCAADEGCGLWPYHQS
jgi:NAD(P)-dependent dehydrogenase (short-subunit alcohol dehydrogenase family)